MMKNWKSFLAGMLAMLLLVFLAGNALAASGRVRQELVYQNIQVTLDGEKLSLQDAQGNPVEPFLLDGTNYLPIRAISQALGLDVGWDSASRTVVLTTPDAEKQVYITRTGAKYHYDSTCSGGTYWDVPLSTAQGLGFEPCSKCVLEEETTSQTTGSYGEAYSIVNGNQPFFPKAS